MVRSAVAAGLAGLLAGAAPAAAFSPAVLDSVVAVIPERPAEGGAPGQGNPEGSAVAVLRGGYLATNVHVLGAARSVQVRLADGRLLAAAIVGRDAPTDIALLKVDADLPVLTPAPEPAIGARVCAVGNQFGMGLSVTCGVVSAVQRTATGFNAVEDFIQTDAAANPGSSGGALVDARGRLVGMVSAIFSADGDANIGVNFAASVELVLRVAVDLQALGRVVRGRAGLLVRDLVGAERARRPGARVTGVIAGGAAAVAGIAVGDVITAVGRRRVRRAADVTSAFFLRRVGEPFAVTLRRAGRGLTLTLSLRP